MKSINLLPKVPYLIKSRDFLALLIGLIGIILIIVQVVLSTVWDNNKISAGLAFQQNASIVRERIAQTTLDTRTLYYKQGVDMVKLVQDNRQDFLPVIQSVLDTMTYQGQIINMNIAEGILVVNTLMLTEEQLTTCIEDFEKVPYFKDMTLTVTEHKLFKPEDKARLLFITGEVVPLTDHEYYTLQLDIKLPKKIEAGAVSAP
ncbi:MAG: hypothetical protein H7X86_07425 [Gorillibacterium sp.]|nr:hypothetical protein [Gorillibacterium sp.]